MITIKPSSAKPGAYVIEGISKRELFAAMILHSIVMREGMEDHVLGSMATATSTFAQNDAERAVIYADALMLELSK